MTLFIIKKEYFLKTLKLLIDERTKQAMIATNKKMSFTKENND